MANQQDNQYYSFVPGEIVFILDHEKSFPEPLKTLPSIVTGILEKATPKLLVQIADIILGKGMDVPEDITSTAKASDKITDVLGRWGKGELMFRRGVELDDDTILGSEHADNMEAPHENDRIKNSFKLDDVGVAVLEHVENVEPKSDQNAIKALLFNMLRDLDKMFIPRDAVEFERPKWAVEHYKKPPYFSILQSDVKNAKSGPVAEMSILLLSLLLSALDSDVLQDKHNGQNVQLSSVSPNWISPGTPTDPNAGTGGGPGTKPVGIDETYAQRVEKAKLWEFTLPESPKPTDAAKDLLALLLKIPEDAKDVNVIILDTAPPAFKLDEDVRWKNAKKPELFNALQEAYTSWAGKNTLLRLLLHGIEDFTFETTDSHLELGKKNGDHVLSYPLNDSGGLKVDVNDKFTIWYAHELMYPPYGPDRAEPFDIRRVCKATGDRKGHQYRHVANDHGTFIAGIIRTLCPTAHIHLVQVLNDYAHGSVMIAARQLKKVTSTLDLEKDTIVVNMSLMFDIPRASDHRLWQLSGDRDSNSLRGIIENLLHALAVRFDLEKTLYVWKYVTEMIAIGSPMPKDEQIGRKNDVEGLMFAAAGNDRHEGPSPNARFPAAFNNIMGVGALKANLVEYTAYSNKADEPTKSGLAAVGGNDVGPEEDRGTDAADGWSDEFTGLLGLYINRYPKKSDHNNYEETEPNSTGWGRWSGTSFAVPVVVGTISQLLAHGFSVTDALDRIVESVLTEKEEEPQQLPFIQKSQIMDQNRSQS